ncbi:MAG: hypothetical protein M1338_04685 [Patescibacteria group bacterium]|nr:hypothetical protein [Patescibacteria group bacterium]
MATIWVDERPQTKFRIGDKVRFKTGFMAGFLIVVANIYPVNGGDVCDLDIYCGSHKQSCIAKIDDLIIL